MIKKLYHFNIIFNVDLVTLDCKPYGKLINMQDNAYAQMDTIQVLIVNLLYIYTTCGFSIDF